MVRDSSKLLHLSKVCSSSLLSSILLCGYTTAYLFNHWKTLGWLQIWAIMKTGSLNIQEQVVLRTYMFIILGSISRNRIAGSQVKSMFKLPNHFHSDYIILHSQQQWRKTLLHHRVTIFNFSHSDKCADVSHHGFVFISLVTNEKHFFHVLFCHPYSLMSKGSLQVFCLFFSFFFFFLFVALRVLYRFCV